MVHDRGEISEECKHRCLCGGLIHEPVDAVDIWKRWLTNLCACLTVNLYVDGIIASLIMCVSVRVSKCLSVFCMMFLHTCWQSKKAFSEEEANPLCWSMLQIEATLGVLIKTALLQLEAKWNWWTRVEGGDEGGERDAGGRWRRRKRWGTRRREWAPLSPLLSALLIPVILFDGIRFINN